MVDHGSFSDAALSLDLCQSTVSHAITGLEQQVGVPLLARGRFGAHTTPVGERVLVHARQVLELLEKIDYETKREKGLQGGTVRIASFRSAATHLLPPVIALFRSRFPNIAVNIIERDRSRVEQALHEGRADIGLLPLPTSDEFQSWEIARDEYVVLLPPSRQLTSKQPTWEELSTHSFILPDHEECFSSVIQNHWAAFNQALEVDYFIREDSTIVSMVAQGLGAAILPRLAASPVPAGVQVCQLPVPLERIIGAAIAPNALHVPATFAFLDALRGTGVFGRHRVRA